MKTIPVTRPSAWPSRIRKIHKWLSFIIGIQLVIWMLSGLYMASIDIDVIHGDHLSKSPAQPIDYQQLSALPTQYQDLSEVRLTTQASTPVYLINSLTQQVAINALTGKLITVDQSYIQTRALETYTQQGSILSISLLPQYPSELGGRKKPIWQVVFDDAFSPTLYFSASSGEFVRARSDLWRIFDLMWVLHIMDYDEGENVNNLLLTFASFVALFAACSGLWLICYSFSHRKQKASSLSVLRSLHKWLAMLVGSQVLLWLIGGLIFNLLASDQVNLKHHLHPQSKQFFSPEQINFSNIINKFPGATSITIQATPTEPLVVFDKRSQLQSVQLATLASVTINQARAHQIAKNVYSTSAAIARSHLVAPGHIESRKLNRSLWQISYDDADSTTLYIDAKSGQALALKDDTWRLKDWFWMLHIMDYTQRSNFNTPLLITAASLASLAALSGFLMLFYVFSRQDFGFKKRLSQYTIQISSVQDGQQTVQVNGAQPLLHALKEQKIELPSGCGGGGTCCQCMITAPHTAQPLTSQEHVSLSMAEINQGRRLACQLQVNSNLEIALSDQATTSSISAKVISSEYKTPFIKEIVLRLPINHGFNFAAGQYVNVDIPSFNSTISAGQVPVAYSQQWRDKKLINQRVSSPSPITRSYSIANKSDDLNTIAFNIKLATPQGGYGPGVASSYLCNLAVGQTISFTGPYGDFTTDPHSDKELVLIGAGAGMAPLKSHIDTLLSQRSHRNISFWFGAREQADIFHQAHFDTLSRRHANFEWHVSLSRPSGDSWQGHRGHIQHALFEQHIESHRQLNNIEFLLCGPKAMMQDVRLRLQRIGVAAGAIKCDEFS